MRGRTPPDRRAGRHTDREGTDPYGIPPVPPVPAGTPPEDRTTGAVPAPRPSGWDRDPRADDRWDVPAAPAPVPAGRAADGGPMAAHASRGWSGADRPSARPGGPRREAPPRPPRDPLPRREPAVPRARSPWDDRCPDDPYGDRLYGYRDDAPDPHHDDPDEGDDRDHGDYGDYRDEQDDRRADRRDARGTGADDLFGDPAYGRRSTDRRPTGDDTRTDLDDGPVAPDLGPPPQRRVRRPFGGGRAAARQAPTAGVAPGPSIRAIAIPAAVGALVAVGLGVWARLHEPTGVGVSLAGFSSGAAAKAWLGSLALLLAVVQGVTGRMLHRDGTDADPLLGTAHRWSGRAAVLVTVPVAVQCLYAFGWSGATTSTLLHSLFGCVFYGAFVTKMLLLRRPGVPGWVLATCGGLLLALLAGVWLTSALWFFTGNGLTF